MKITLTRTLAGHENGATIERSDKVAQLLIANGAAVEVEQSKRTNSDDTKPDDTKPDDTKTSEAKPTRTRRSAARKPRGDTDDSATTSGKPAGQEGGGTPLPSSAPTAG